MLSEVLEKKQLTLVFGDNAAVVRNAMLRDFKDILHPSFIYEAPYNSNTITPALIFDLALRGKEYSIYDDEVAINYVHTDGRITVGEIDKVKGLLLVPYCLFEYAEETSAIIDVGFHNLKNLKDSTNNG